MDAGCENDNCISLKLATTHLHCAVRCLVANIRWSLLSLKHLFTASRRMTFMVLIPSSATVSRVRMRLRTLTLGMTSDAESEAELTTLVNSSKGARVATVFFSIPHWFAVSVAGSSSPSDYAYRALCKEALNHVLLLWIFWWHIQLNWALQNYF